MLIATKASKFIQNQDLFGYHISLNLNKGSSTHKTIFGGVFSILITIFMYFYFYLNIYKLLNHQENFETSYDSLITGKQYGKVYYSNETDMINFYVM